MLDMYNKFVDLSWWVNVVVVALLLNIVSSYIKSFIDAFLAKVSDSYRKRVEEQTNYYENLRKQAEEDQDLQIRITLEQMRLKTETTYRFVLGVVCLYLSSTTAPEYAAEGFSKLITWFFKLLFSGIAIISLFSSGYSNYRSTRLGWLIRSFPTSKTLDRL